MTEENTIDPDEEKEARVAEAQKTFEKEKEEDETERAWIAGHHFQEANDHFETSGKEMDEFDAFMQECETEEKNKHGIENDTQA